MEQTSTYFLHCYIAGLQYYEVLEFWKNLEIGQTLELISEPNNRYVGLRAIIWRTDSRFFIIKDLGTIKLQKKSNAYLYSTKSYESTQVYRHIRDLLFWHYHRASCYFRQAIPQYSKALCGQRK